MKLNIKVLTLNVLSTKHYGLNTIHILQLDNSGFSEKKNTKIQ